MNNERVLQAALIVKVLKDLKSETISTSFDGVSVKIGGKSVLYLHGNEFPTHIPLPKLDFELAQLQELLEVIRDKTARQLQDGIDKMLSGEK